MDLLPLASLWSWTLLTVKSSAETPKLTLIALSSQFNATLAVLASSPPNSLLPCFLLLLLWALWCVIYWETCFSSLPPRFFISATLLLLSWFNLIHWALLTRWFKKQNITHIAKVFYHSGSNNGNADNGREIRLERIKTIVVAPPLLSLTFLSLSFLLLFCLRMLLPPFPLIC